MNVRMWYEKNLAKGLCYCCNEPPETPKLQAFLEVNGVMIKKWKTCGHHESDVLIEQLVRNVNEALQEKAQ